MVIYNVKEKHKIVAKARHPNNTVKGVAREYGIWPSQIRCWDKIMTQTPVDSLLCRNPKKFTFRPGRQRQDQPVFDELLNVFSDLRERGLPVTSSMLQVEFVKIKALQNAAADPPIAVDAHEGSSKALYHRINRWLKANRIGMRMATHVAQNTRFNQDIIDDFVLECNTTIALYHYNPDYIVNMDETNVYFEMKCTSTLSNRGVSTVNISTTGCTHRCTVLLACTVSGKKLPPYVVFKGGKDKTVDRALRRVQHAGGIICAAQESAWVDSDIMCDWSDRVWRPYINGNHSYLMLDHCSAHMTSQCVRKLLSMQTNVSLNRMVSCGPIFFFKLIFVIFPLSTPQIDYIPAGYTSKLQMLDVGVNAPFKKHLKEAYLSFRQQQPRDINVRPDRDTVVEWIATSWNNITPANITNTWRKIGIAGAEPPAAAAPPVAGAAAAPPAPPVAAPPAPPAAAPSAFAGPYNWLADLGLLP